jgi:transporter family protein
MPKWLWYSILTVLFWGVWGVVSKVAVRMMSPMVNQVIFTLGLIPLVLVVLRSKQAFTGRNRVVGGAFAFVTGILGGVGNVTLYEALSHGGKASTVVPITGLYPLFTVVAALPLLREKLNKVQGVGIALAAAAILLFASG